MRIMGNLRKKEIDNTTLSEPIDSRSIFTYNQFDDNRCGGNVVPCARKDHSCLNIKVDAALYRKLMEVSEEAGQLVPVEEVSRNDN